MTETNRLRLTLFSESVFGVTPTTPTGHILNCKGHSLRFDARHVVSETIRPDRNIVDLVKVGEGAAGEIWGEPQYDTTGAYWRALKRSLQTDAEDAAVSATGATAAGAVLTSAAIAAASQPGDILRLRTSADLLVDSGYFRVISINSNDLTLDLAPSVTTGLKVTRGIRLKNGTTKATDSAEATLLELPHTEVFKGLGWDGYQLDVVDEQVPQFRFFTIGASSDGGSASEIAGATRNAAPTTELYNCKNHIPVIRIGGLAKPAKRISLGWRNGMRARSNLGSNAVASLGSSACSVQGSVEAYFADNAEYLKAVQDTASSMFFVLEDSADVSAGTGGNAMAYSVSRIKWTRPEKTVPGQNTDVMLRLAFQATLNGAEGATGATVRVYAFPAAL